MSISVDHVDFVSVPVKDLEVATGFYSGMLGMERSSCSERGFAEFEAGNLTLGVIVPDKLGLEHRRSPNPLALRVDDVAEARATLEAQGVEFQGETIDSGVCHMAVFSDPDGNALMLHHRYAPRS